MVPVIDPGRRSPSSVIWRSTLLRCASSPGSVSDIGDTSSTLSVLYTFRQEAQKKATPHILTPVSRARPGARIDFQYRERVNFFSHSVLLFHNFFGSRTLVNLTRREAGENPVLPRNCKRGNRNRSLGKPGKAACIRRTSYNRPHSRSQETGVNRPPKPLSRVKGGVHVVSSYSH